MDTMTIVSGVGVALALTLVLLFVRRSWNGIRRALYALAAVVIVGMILYTLATQATATARTATVATTATATAGGATLILGLVVAGAFVVAVGALIVGCYYLRLQVEREKTQRLAGAANRASLPMSEHARMEPGQRLPDYVVEDASSVGTWGGGVWD